MKFITGMIGSLVRLWIMVIVLLIIITMLVACSPPGETHSGAGDAAEAAGVASTADAQERSAAPAGRAALPRASLIDAEIPGITEIVMVHAAAPEAAAPEAAVPEAAAPDAVPALVAASETAPEAAPSPPLAAPAAPPSPENPPAPPAPVAVAPAEPSVTAAAAVPPVTTPAPQPPAEPLACTGYRIEDLLFESASATLAPQAASSLAAMAELIPADATVIVVGHTDSLPIAMGNQALSEMRAEAVTGALIANGVSQAQLERVEGRGDSEPIATNDTPDGRRMNRRVEVFVNCPDIPAS